jgi:predicted amidophosphoribosyltransferase
MKACPFCAENIEDAARKCKHCGEYLDPARRFERSERFGPLPAAMHPRPPVLA